MSIDTWFAVHSIEAFWWAFGLFFAAALVEMLFPPFPGDAVFFFGLVTLAANGTSVYGAIIAACAGGTVGFIAVYWIGRVYGRKFFMRRPSGLWSRASLEKVERWFIRWGGWVIVIGRFLSGVRALIPLVAGIGSYPPTRGNILGAISIVIWNGMLATVALVLGENWETISRTYSTYNYIFWLAAGVLILLWGGRWYWLRRRRA
ncbi:MAG: DedA family protein [Candidatus Zixiibacteriota bacterium]